jgi:2-oxoglutarate dehydrogenase E2 component (dihydrolipoamide succinyltransferase)
LQVRGYADETIVKVPQMAESITEGTLKQWSKQIGDYVEQDEEIATIETDKVGQPPRACTQQNPA